MSGKCFEIGVIQAFLDGETAPELTARVAEHVAACNVCALTLAEAEEESARVFVALDRELNTLVPTHRLWTRINDSITVENNGLSVWQRLRAVFLLSRANPTLAAAAVVVVFTGVFALLSSIRQEGEIASVGQMASTQARPENIFTQNRTLPVDNPRPNQSAPGQPSLMPASESESPVLSAKSRSRTAGRDFIEPRRRVSAGAVEAVYLPGEDGYVKTIADLKQSVDGQKDLILSPSSRIAYERDMAVVNDSIGRMRTVVRKSPRNQAARQVLYSAYQDKIDLLNSVAQRQELMASLR